MNSKYKVLKYNFSEFKNVEDLVSIEEPLEISLRFKEQDKWINQILVGNTSYYYHNGISTCRRVNYI